MGKTSLVLIPVACVALACCDRRRPSPGAETQKEAAAELSSLPEGVVIAEAPAPEAGTAAGPVIEGPEGRRAFDDLAAYYADESRTPGHAAAIGRLASPDGEARREAGGYLLALFRQSFADETNGRSPYRRQMWFGAGPLCVAREFRKELAKQFGGRAEGAEALDAALWLLDDEMLAENQAEGVNALRRIEGPRADEALGGLAARPHPNPAVLAGVLSEIAERKLADLRTEVTRLCSHHRASIREAAGAAARALGVTDVPDHPTLLITPWLDGQLRKIEAMIVAEIPEGARWCRFTYRHPRAAGGGEADPFEGRGWITDQEDEICRIVDWFAQEHALPKAATEIKDETLAEAAGRLLAIRAGDKSGVRELSRRGGLTGQFEQGSLRLPEALVAAWCNARGEKAAAARLLVPRMEALDDDRWLIWITRDYLGHMYHQEMLGSFSYERNYEGALRLARHLSKDLFDGYEYQGRAKELAAQLQRRTDDFKTFVLPAPEEWERVKVQLPRARQIAYLAGRLRLLNCMQWGQPGGVSYQDDQYGVPPFLSDARPPEKARRINPYVELLDMNITIAELPALIPYLADENYMLVFSYWRDFHPGRTLHRVNWAVANVVNFAALRELADLKDYHSQDTDGRRAYLDRLIGWCRANGKRSQAEVILEALRNAKTREELRAAASAAVRHGVADAAPILAARASDPAAARGDIPMWCYDLHTEKAVPAARAWIADPDGKTRFYAACILLEQSGRDKEAAFAAIQEIARRDETWHALALEPLLAAGDEDMAEFAAQVLKTRGFQEGRGDAAAILHVLLLHGREEAVEYVVRRLDGGERGYESEGEWGGEPVRRTLIDGDRLAAQVAAMRADGYEYPMFAPDADRAREREDLKTWLTAQVARIRSGEPHGLKTKARPLRRPEWRIDAP